MSGVVRTESTSGSTSTGPGTQSLGCCASLMPASRYRYRPAPSSREAGGGRGWGASASLVVHDQTGEQLRVEIRRLLRHASARLAAAHDVRDGRRRQEEGEVVLALRDALDRGSDASLVADHVAHVVLRLAHERIEREAMEPRDLERAHGLVELREDLRRIAVIPRAQEEGALELSPVESDGSASELRELRESRWFCISRESFDREVASEPLGNRRSGDPLGKPDEPVRREDPETGIARREDRGGAEAIGFGRLSGRLPL